MNVGTTRLALLITAALATGIAACGEDESSRPAGNDTDRAFVDEMVPHHRSAVEMAEVAQERSTRPEVRDLAHAIMTTQNEEISRMQSVDEVLADAGVDPGELGMASHEMGMDADADTLKDAKPFDREFIDAMIPHHQGAIRMARLELEQGDNRELKRMAQAVIDAQSREIDQMNTWRVSWFGSRSPAGGVPTHDGGHSEHGR